MSMGAEYLSVVNSQKELILRQGQLGGANPAWWFKPVKRQKRAKKVFEIKAMID